MKGHLELKKNHDAGLQRETTFTRQWRDEWFIQIRVLRFSFGDGIFSLHHHVRVTQRVFFQVPQEKGAFFHVYHVASKG